MNVNVFGNEAQTLFPTLPPSNLYVSNITRKFLQTVTHTNKNKNNPNRTNKQTSKQTNKI